MLPKATSTFTIPSIHADTELECRLYHPPKSIYDDENRSRKGAVIAHPYAPLGGCVDDPVIHFVGEAILKQGYILGLFNFRGAGASKGRTSWTGRPEQADYISFVGFFTLYLYGLDFGSPGSSPSTSPTKHQSPSRGLMSPVSKVNNAITLILGGYSYGSLITSQLPDIEALMFLFSKVTTGSAAAEIRMRALHLSRERNNDIRRVRKRGRTLAVEDAVENAAYGGDECEPGTRRTSRESRRSVDVVRKSVEASRARLHLKKRGSEDTSRSPNPEKHLDSLDLPRPRVCHLLISPVLPPISSFLTMFSKQWKLPGPSAMTTPGVLAKDQFELNETLAVFGSSDGFTSSKKLQKWAKGLADRTSSRFVYHEVVGAGHFWQEEGAVPELQKRVTDWLRSVDKA